MMVSVFTLLHIYSHFWKHVLILFFLHTQESLHNQHGKFVKNMMTETACTLFLNNKIALVPTILAVLIKKT